MGADCSCDCADREGEMKYQEVGIKKLTMVILIILFIIAVPKYNAKQLSNAGRSAERIGKEKSSPQSKYWQRTKFKSRR